ncbi:MAG: Na/Pi cotransporter family protein, partial [Clostridia bacterium]|nr:Na/Pi cotransporter family protein [Clostridia bacterium]
AIGVIMGANVGTAVTAWITGLSGINGAAGATEILSLLKPSAWVPILAVIGVIMTMFGKRERNKNVGVILLGFAVLMTGMEGMSAAVEPLKGNTTFQGILTMFENPILGVLAGTILTAIVQSSSASVGILQSLSTTGAITYGAAIPIIMGQNIGTCITAMLSAIGATKNAKRAALIHLYFNVIGVAVCLSLFYLADFVVGLIFGAGFAFVDYTVNMWSIAAVHTLFKILCVILFAPFTKWLEKLACVSIKDSKEEEHTNMLDERLLDTPTVAVERAKAATLEMAKISCDALALSLNTLTKYDLKDADTIRAYEDKADNYEDMLGTYLVKLSGRSMTERDSHEITKLLHLIGVFERMSDHAVNILESAEEMNDKKITFSSEAQRELKVLCGAVNEILDITYKSFVAGDIEFASVVEPLEQVIDNLKDKIKANHIKRLQKSECTIEHGFVLSDLLNNLERVSDHCSNIAGCVIEISRYDALDMHEYLNAVKNSESGEYARKYEEYSAKYAL